jgi:hypothetical protein
VFAIECDTLMDAGMALSLVILSSEPASVAKDLMLTELQA